LLASLINQILSIPIADWIIVHNASDANLIGAGGRVIGLPVLIAAFESVRNYSLALGIGGIAGGILLFVNHKKQLDAILASGAEERAKAYESRKYRRRAIASAMIASLGCMMAALYWVTDARVFSVFILMIMALLIGILGVALIDMFSVGLQQIATPDEKSQKAMIEELLRRREKSETEESKEEN
jgi:hypothetical protein